MLEGYDITIRRAAQPGSNQGPSDCKLFCVVIVTAISQILKLKNRIVSNLFNIVFYSINGMTKFPWRLRSVLQYD